MSKMLINFFEFFLVLSAMFLLFSFISHLLLRRISLEKVFLSLEHKGLGLGNIVASLIGAVTPFCVCTTIPIFTAMVQMGIKTNIAISFLLSSPLVSISAAALLIFLFGVKFSIYYIAAALIFSILGGFLVRWFKFDDEISEKLKTGFSDDRDDASDYKKAANSSFRLFKDLLIPLLIGAVIAGGIHNYVPVRLIETVNAYPLWVIIPLVALIGFPIYSNIMVLAPIGFALANKGMNQAAVITFLMSGAGISFPTTIVLRSLLRPKLFVFYLLFTFLYYCVTGFVFNLIK
jgi:uncharacterized membrane protein YraQ (UPF0718 family)